MLYLYSQVRDKILATDARISWWKSAGFKVAIFKADKAAVLTILINELCIYLDKGELQLTIPFISLNTK
jgi:hypothetical protein